MLRPLGAPNTSPKTISIESQTQRQSEVVSCLASGWKCGYFMGLQMPISILYSHSFYAESVNCSVNLLVNCHATWCYHTPHRTAPHPCALIHSDINFNFPLAIQQMLLGHFTSACLLLLSCLGNCCMICDPMPAMPDMPYTLYLLPYHPYTIRFGSTQLQHIFRALFLIVSMVFFIVSSFSIDCDEVIPVLKR